jgi:dTDP-4-amino-4,6-dideoxygalactose transaminase
MLALEIGPGDEVITTANTFAATVEAVRLVGAQPVLVDVTSEEYTLDPARLEEAITARTKAIVPVHLYGRPANMKPLQAIAARHHVPIIEEACQAAGASYHGQRCGAMGLMAVFSFGRTKSFAGLGEGGCITTNDENLAHRLHILNQHGTYQGDRQYLGFNFRMHPLEAAILLARLEHAEYWIAERRKIAAQYNAYFMPLEIVQNPLPDPAQEHSYYVYAIETSARSALIKHLDEHHVGWGLHYPQPIHWQTAHQQLAEGADLPVTERLAEQILSLPMYVGLTPDDVEYVIAVVTDFFTRKSV